MAMVMDQQQQQQQQEQQQQQQTYKHYCRICKKGFGCGRALGGHMRAHGINDDAVGAHEPDDEPSSCGGWDAASPSAGNKRMYALRTNPNRLKSCRVCENCGKEFVSWKSFLEHGKCSSDDDETDPDASEFVSLTEEEGDDDDDPAIHAAWSKGKRSRRTKATTSSSVPPSSEDEDLANCLVMLSSARVEPMDIVETTEESCASASKEEDKPPPPPRSYSIAAPAFAPPLQERSKAFALPPTSSSAAPRGMFECKACKKVFTSHQALGGHRASHKKVKGCFAAKLDDADDVPANEEEVFASRDNTSTTTNNNNKNNNNSSEISAMALAIVPFDNAPLAVTPLKKKNKVHECSICHRVFTSGQALGGHKRCHWITTNSPDPGPIAKLHPLPPELTLRPMFDNSKPLDLNLPAPAEELAAARNANIGSPLVLDVPAAVFLKPWNVDHSNASNKNKAATSSNNVNNVHNMSSKDNNGEGVNLTVDDEADSKEKLAKLTDLKDINMGGGSSPWLQVGIGSSANEESEP